MSVAREISIDDINISQAAILGKIRIYLELRHRDASFIEGMKIGHCVGFTALATYALFLSLMCSHSRHSKKNEERDDWEWLRNLFVLIANWNGKFNLKQTEGEKLFCQNMDRLINLITYLQKTCEYDSAQIKLYANMQDTVGHRFKEEYTFSGIFSTQDFIKSISHPLINGGETTTLFHELVKENRILFIANFNHIISLIINRDCCYLYDSNSSCGWVVYEKNKIKEVVNEIFCSFLSVDEYEALKKQDIKIALGISVVCSERTKIKTYPMREHLLEALALDYSAKDTFNPSITALYMAVRFGCENCTKFHLKNSPIPPSIYANMGSSDGDMPLHIAIHENHIKVVNILLEAGADINFRQKKFKNAIDFAVIYNRVEIIKMLLKKGADPNAMIQATKLTPLFYALSRNYIDAVEVLLKNKANVNQIPRSGTTLLHEAVDQHGLNVVKLLLKYHANINAKNRTDSTPLLLALHREKLDIANYLIHSKKIQIGIREYQAVDFLSKKYLHNKKFQQSVLHSRPLFVLTLIRREIAGLKEKYPKFSKRARAQLMEAKKKILQNDLSPEEKMVYLLETVLPAFSNISPRNQYSMLWKSPDFQKIILNRIKNADLEMDELLPRVLSRHKRMAPP